MDQIEKDQQIIGRAQRPGRNGKLNVLRFCYENEVVAIRDNSTELTI